ncbi:MAG TPA: DnaJ domain-containing protein [Candidatus Nanoarchaeia archaeon]|nr:DnaJ domain-containing protein [Candidatus Nanoarchaeia archaeon]
MTTITIKGHDITPIIIRDSYDRRAVQYKNSIIEVLGKLGLTEDDIDIKHEVSAFRSAPASVSWYLDGHHLYYSYKISKKHVENLYIVFKVIDLEVKALLAGQKTPEEFISAFLERPDVEEKRKEARAILGVEQNVIDIGVINARYKSLAKKNHPDMPGGDTERFKEINSAHQILKRELL